MLAYNLYKIGCKKFNSGAKNGQIEVVCDYGVIMLFGLPV